MPTLIAVHLAGASPESVSAERLVDLLWPNGPPSSGRNALQRHVSRLRGQFREGFASDFDPVCLSANGYRFADGVTSDFDLLQSGVIQDPESNEAPRWWAEPIPGAPWEGTQTIRARLSQYAVEIGVSWSEEARTQGRHLDAARALESLAEADIYRLAVWRLAADAAAASGDLPYMVYLAERLADLAAREALPDLAELAVELRVKATRRAPAATLQQPINHWMLGNVSEAIASVAAADVPTDLAPRVTRWIRTYDPSDGWARQIMNDLLMSETWAERQGERIVVALDGVAHGQNRTVEPYLPGSRSLHHLRSLRIAWFSRLGLPMSPEMDQIVEDLATIDHPDARVEAVRFAAVNDLRRGKWDSLFAGLDRYDEVVTTQWPAEYDAFSSLSKLIISLHPPLEKRCAEGPGSRFPRMASDRVAAELAEVMRVLRHTSEVSAAVLPAVEMAAATLMDDAALGLRLMADRALGNADAARRRVAPVKASENLGLPHHHRHLLDVAAADHAIWLGDRPLADLCLRVLEPFSGQELGLWPIDGLLGPADAFLESLDTVPLR